MFTKNSSGGRMFDSNTTESSQNGNMSFGAMKVTSTPISSMWNRKNESGNNSLLKTTPKGSIWNRHKKYSLSNTNTSPNLNGSFESPDNSTMFQTGPLLASTRYNIDIGTLTDTKSPGLTTRIVQYNSQDSINNKPRLTHQPKYSSPGQFPNIQLNKSPLPQMRPLRKTVTVRIAPPDTSYRPADRTLIFNESSMMYPSERKPENLQTEISTRSVLDALKEISRKRIHAREEDSEVNKRLKSNAILDEDMCNKSKRNRDSESPTFSNSGVSPTTKKYRSSIKDIIMSHSSSVGMLQNQYSMKRKADKINSSHLNNYNNNKQVKLNSNNEINLPNGSLHADVSKKNFDGLTESKTSQRNLTKEARSPKSQTASEINHRTRNHYRFNPEIFETNRVELPIKEVSDDVRLITLLGVLDGLDKETIDKKIKEISKSKQKNMDVTDSQSETKPLIGILTPPKSKTDTVKKKVTFNLPEEVNDISPKESTISSLPTVINVSNNSKESDGEKSHSSNSVIESNTTSKSESTNSPNDVKKPGILVTSSIPNTAPQNFLSVSNSNTNKDSFLVSSPQSKASPRVSNGSIFTSPSQVCSVTFGNTSPIVSCGTTINTVPSVSSAISKSIEIPASSLGVSPIGTSNSPKMSFGIKPVSPAASSGSVTFDNVNSSSPKMSPIFSFETKVSSPFNMSPISSPAINTQTPVTSGFGIVSNKTDNNSNSGQIKSPLFNFSDNKSTVSTNNNVFEQKSVTENKSIGQSNTGGFVFDIKGSTKSGSTPLPLFGLQSITNQSSPAINPIVPSVEKSIATPPAFGVQKSENSLSTFGSALNKNSSATVSYGAFNSDNKISNNLSGFGTNNTKPNDVSLNNSVSKSENNQSSFGVPVSTTAGLSFTLSTTNNNPNIQFGSTVNTISNSLQFGASTTSVNSSFAATDTKPEPDIFGAVVKKETDQSLFSFGTGKNTSFNNTNAQSQPKFNDTTKSTTFASPFGTAAFGQNTNSSVTTSTAQNVPTFGGFGATNSTTNSEKLSFGNSTTSNSDSKLFTFGSGINTNETNFGSTTSAGSFGNTSKNTFGTTNSSSIFGSTAVPQTTSSAFGVQTTTSNIFGSTSTPNPFKGTVTTKSNIFGSNPSFIGDNQTSSPFGTTQQQTGFGSANQTNNVFGATPQNNNIFGPSTQPNSSGFGSNNSNNNNTFGSTTTQPSNNIFGPSVQPPITAFGTTSNTTTSPFNSTGQPPAFGSSTNMAFGAANQSSNVFGTFGNTVTSNQTHTSTSSSVFTFGSSSQPNTAASTKPSAFQFGANSAIATPGNFNFSAGSNTAPGFGSTNTFGSSGTTPAFGTPSIPQFAPPSGSGGAMFSIGSGSTAPRPRSIARARRQK